MVEDDQGMSAPGSLNASTTPISTLGRGLVFHGASDPVPACGKELCQSFINSIQAEDPTPRFYHFHSSFVEARMHFKEHPEEYEGMSMTQVQDAFKGEGQCCARRRRPAQGHALRNGQRLRLVQQQLLGGPFPKLAMRVLRNVKFTGDNRVSQEELGDAQIRAGIPAQAGLRRRRVPEGYPDEVKNTSTTWFSSAPMPTMPRSSSAAAKP